MCITRTNRVNKLNAISDAPQNVQQLLFKKHAFTLILSPFTCLNWIISQRKADSLLLLLLSLLQQQRQEDDDA